MSQNIPKNLQTTPPEIKTTFDTIWIKENVKAILYKINQLEIKGITNPFDFEMEIMESHPEFYQSHPFLIKRLCKRGDMSMLYKMLEQLNNVESGDKSLAGVELNLGEELANQYLYPVINNKK